MSKVMKIFLATLCCLLFIVVTAALSVWLLNEPWCYIVSGGCGFIIGLIYSYVLQNIVDN